ncbi:MAG: type II toxin-antitoxin system death-on-curing family toxin [Acidobacteria bacterium]|nr:type II toxin-antitoxin system death-on-curing family toxin [Acidobacteriota bacterium]
MKRPVWVLRETVLGLHEQLLAAFGGASGIRDEGLLDSALARPENLLVYGKPTLFDLAASYGFGLVKNHPFVDGNKRIGFAVAALFIELNGYRVVASEADVVVRTLGLAAGQVRESDYAAWLKAESRRA